MRCKATTIGKTFTLSLLLTLHSTCICVSQVIPEDPDLLNIRAEVNKMVADSIIPSMAISVIKDGHILWQEAIGYADIETKRLANLQSAYPLGSVSKSITATGIMHMINAGQASLFDNIQSEISPVQLKNMKGETPEIKLWQLISQNGGLNHGYGVFEREVVPKTKDDIKRFYESSTIVAFAPGAVYHYSNHSFDVAELLIVNKSGETFQDYMNKTVFYPLRMTHTYAYPDLSDENLFVSTYTASLKKRQANEVIYPAGGAGFWSSIHDMTQYALFHLGEIQNDKIISSANLKRMHEFRQGPADMFGIGWFNSDGNLYSNGNVSGGNAVISINRKNNLAVICLLNRTSNDGIADQVAGKISNVFIEKGEDLFKEYKRIYAAPYTSRIDLTGNWKGSLKDPTTSKEIPVNLIFQDDGTITFTLVNQSIVLNKPTYNLFQELKANFRIQIPAIYDEQTDCSLTMKRNGDTFSGYLFYGKTSKKSFYTMPLFIQVVRRSE